MENTYLHILGKSKTRQALLDIFFSQPNSRFYTRQLQKVLDIKSVGTLHRELQNLEYMHIVKSSREANLRYFQLDKTNPFFEELNSIISKTIGFQARVRSSLITLQGLKIAFIYGSYATGKAGPKSDIDLFLIGALDISDLNFKLTELENYFKKEVNYSAFAVDDYIEEAAKTGGFIQRVLSAPKIFILGSEHELGMLAKRKAD